MNLRNPLIQSDAPVPLMTVRQAAAFAGLSVPTFYRYLADPPPRSAEVTATAQTQTDEAPPPATE